jgi:hypothetical protein
VITVNEVAGSAEAKEMAGLAAYRPLSPRRRPVFTPEKSACAPADLLEFTRCVLYFDRKQITPREALSRGRGPRFTIFMPV